MIVKEVCPTFSGFFFQEAELSGSSGIMTLRSFHNFTIRSLFSTNDLPPVLFFHSIMSPKWKCQNLLDCGQNDQKRGGHIDLEATQGKTRAFYCSLQSCSDLKSSPPHLSCHSHGGAVRSKRGLKCGSGEQLFFLYCSSILGLTINLWGQRTWVLRTDIVPPCQYLC